LAPLSLPCLASAAPQNGPDPKDTEWTYYGCTSGISSCYAQGAPDTCCGCVDWWTVGVPVPPAPVTQTCVNHNPEWQALMQPRLTWLKAACPSCYVFPFDDMVGLFLFAATLFKCRRGLMLLATGAGCRCAVLVASPARLFPLRGCCRCAVAAAARLLPLRGCCRCAVAAAARLLPLRGCYHCTMLGAAWAGTPCG
jgi:hypothetical protein